MTSPGRYDAVIASCPHTSVVFQVTFTDAFHTGSCDADRGKVVRREGPWKERARRVVKLSLLCWMDGWEIHHKYAVHMTCKAAQPKCVCSRTPKGKISLGCSQRPAGGKSKSAVFLTASKSICDSLPQVKRMKMSLKVVAKSLYVTEFCHSITQVACWPFTVAHVCHLPAIAYLTATRVGQPPL